MSEFRSWLAENEEHPFINWHKQYQNIVKQEKLSRRNWGQGRKSLPTPISSTQFANNQYLPVTRILQINGDTSGSYGHGDHEETPADDPLKYATWNVLIDSTQATKLKGKTALVCDKSGGSYHERWADISVYVIDEDNGFSLDKRDYDKITKFFKFDNLAQTFNELKALHPNIENPAQENETAEQYWQRIMSTVKGKNPHLNPSDSYNDDDNYYKSQER